MSKELDDLLLRIQISAVALAEICQSAKGRKLSDKYENNGRVRFFQDVDISCALLSALLTVANATTEFRQFFEKEQAKNQN